MRVKSVTNGRFEVTHGHSKPRTPTYHSWDGMIQRCTNPKEPAFKHYGGRGIKICARWMEFENFLADMGERPVGLELERKDNNRGYEPGNCKWATRTEQLFNRSNTRLLTLNGVTLTQAEWARTAGLNSGTLQRRLERGWTLVDALTRKPL